MHISGDWYFFWSQKEIKKNKGNILNKNKKVF